MVAAMSEGAGQKEVILKYRDWIFQGLCAYVEQHQGGPPSPEVFDRFLTVCFESGEIGAEGKKRSKRGADDPEAEQMLYDWLYFPLFYVIKERRIEFVAFKRNEQELYYESDDMVQEVTVQTLERVWEKLDVAKIRAADDPWKRFHAYVAMQAVYKMLQVQKKRADEAARYKPRDFAAETEENTLKWGREAAGHAGVSAADGAHDIWEEAGYHDLTLVETGHEAVRVLEEWLGEALLRLKRTLRRHLQTIWDGAVDICAVITDDAQQEAQFDGQLCLIAQFLRTIMPENKHCHEDMRCYLVQHCCQNSDTFHLHQSRMRAALAGGAENLLEKLPRKLQALLDR
ncbi:hypothetical protein [Heliophilum fasciatum]|uniref:Uncharacterized protein n=1 Tax=Heliophilum fasciatum TaxID=35700 RepID=A0A4R2RKS4_9FIRM|nr:hypothetical protein [Heliophilum fasciatum]MCW2279330.1 hypothetical protein [Heliophilum fasciatum]TCP60311.1 hypothetical protein EDD73_13910 [Heliophilum fasciatum]